MDTDHIFKFKSDISSTHFPEFLNNPFNTNTSKIGRIAVQEFQDFIQSESPNWGYDFDSQKGKMFGVLVVQKPDKTYCYLGTVSGKLSRENECEKFVPSIFDESVDDFFINRGMTELTEIGNEIKLTKKTSEIAVLTERRKNRSIELQRQLFQNYHFLNLYGEEKNVLEIFEDSSHGKPPSAAGECAAPKLLQYAFKHNLKPIALAEFWWGKAPKNKEREHKEYYPACKNKCRPILEYMLDDKRLFEEANPSIG